MNGRGNRADTHQKPKGPRKPAMRAVVWLQILVVLCLLGYSTYSLSKGDFEQAFLPYPVLIIYYLLFARSNVKTTSSRESQDQNIRY
jgi:hypothetical protein